MNYEQAIREAEARVDRFFSQTPEEREVEYRRVIETRLRRVEDQLAELIKWRTFMNRGTQPEHDEPEYPVHRPPTK